MVKKLTCRTFPNSTWVSSITSWLIIAPAINAVQNFRLSDCNLSSYYN